MFNPPTFFFESQNYLKLWFKFQRGTNFPSDKTRPLRNLEISNKLTAMDKSDEKNKMKSLLRKEEIHRVSLLDLKNLEKNPPIWKTIKIDYRKGFSDILKIVFAKKETSILQKRSRLFLSIQRIRVVK